MKVSGSQDKTAKAIQAGLLSWLLPGAGHFALGQRGVGVVCLVAIALPYFVGLALGGVLDSVNPRTNRWLFVAELGTGGFTVPAYLVSQSVERHVDAIAGIDRGERERLRAQYMSFYPESDVAQIYLATAGLLNILVIIDAIARATTNGLPTFHRAPHRPETAEDAS